MQILKILKINLKILSLYSINEHYQDYEILKDLQPISVNRVDETRRMRILQDAQRNR
ncbi:MAG: hypothetical protein LUC34_00210 [Campylobacter sp.]|nr:hypothetical protein [Campylobacter sp.]